MPAQSANRRPAFSCFDVRDLADRNAALYRRRARSPRAIIRKTRQHVRAGTDREEAMSTTLSRAEIPELGIRALKASPVIIATDGREQSDPALTAGRILAGDNDAALRVVTVVRPSPLVSPEASVPYSVEADVLRRAEQKHAVLEQMRRVWGDEPQLDVEVFDGDAAT